MDILPRNRNKYSTMRGKRRKRKTGIDRTQEPGFTTKTRRHKESACCSTDYTKQGDDGTNFV
ncbi:MAG: hypothetical protein DMG08_00245 [Acidobacteria bacterium]|nr:MAG: hypothetical protein DMG08_00245 [Acidobacteriota bacterium]